MLYVHHLRFGSARCNVFGDLVDLPHGSGLRLFGGVCSQSELGIRVRETLKLRARGRGERFMRCGDAGNGFGMHLVVCDEAGNRDVLAVAFAARRDETCTRVWSWI
jgi:hypothetical protein